MVGACRGADDASDATALDSGRRRYSSFGRPIENGLRQHLSPRFRLGHVPPDWPDGTPQQIHLDLWVDDPAAAHDLVMSLGATVLKDAEDGDSPDNFQVYADPAGHPFCLCWVNPRERSR
jgi:hypothetical protein